MVKEPLLCLFVCLFVCFAFPSLAKVHLGETEAWLTVCPHCKERLPRELSAVQVFS